MVIKLKDHVNTYFEIDRVIRYRPGTVNTASRQIDDPTPKQNFKNYAETLIRLLIAAHARLLV